MGAGKGSRREGGGPVRTISVRARPQPGGKGTRPGCRAVRRDAASPGAVPRWNCASARTLPGGGWRCHRRRARCAPSAGAPAGLEEAQPRQRLVVADQQVGAAPAQQLLPVLVLGAAVAEGEARLQDAVEEALQQRRQAAPPDRVDEHQVLGPVDLPLRFQQVGFEHLALFVAFVEDRVEGQLAQLQFAHHVILAARALGVAFGEQVAEALALGRADDQQDALAVAFQRGGAGLGGFNHGGRPPASAPAVPIRRTALRPGSPAAAPRRAGWCLRRRPSWRFRRPCRSRCAGSVR